MVNWVEEIVSSNVRIVCHLSSTGAIDQSPLTYIVEKRGEADRGPFATFDEAMRIALDQATDAYVGQLSA